MELEDLRKQINETDNEITALFAKRMEIAGEIAKYKVDNDLPVFDKLREREILNRLTENQSEEMAMYTKMLYTTMFDLSRSYQGRRVYRDSDIVKKVRDALENTPREFTKQAVVACQGTEGAYSQIACDRLFARPSIMYMSSFQGVFQAVEKNLC